MYISLVTTRDTVMKISLFGPGFINHHIVSHVLHFGFKSPFFSLEPDNNSYHCLMFSLLLNYGLF